MRITRIQLKNFKRFTDLVIRDIPESAKVVVLVGPNGCGKSSVFDAITTWFRIKAGTGFNSDQSYYRKDSTESFDWNRSIDITLAGGQIPSKESVYFRTAYRNDPDFMVGTIQRLGAPSERNNTIRAIDGDATVAENYQRLVYETMSGVYDSKNSHRTVEALREELIGEIRASMLRVFGDLLLDNISDPLGAGAFQFTKGSAQSYHYKNLSGGEKAAFDLLLDLNIKKKYFPDAVYCIDELETHLHTRVQGAMLTEMARIVPEKSQLWVTTHSLGVIRAAQEMALANPGSLCVLDFDAADQDEPREIAPSDINRISWEKMLSLAIDDLSTRVAPKTLIVCEGSSTGTRRKNFDSEIYNRVLGARFSGLLFISGGSSNQVGIAAVSIRETMMEFLPNTRILAICDRDDKSDDEVSRFEDEKAGFVLPLRNLESYLFADDVIEALANREGKGNLLAEALSVKAKAIQASVLRGNPSDDLKSASGEIYVGLKRLLGLQRCGNTTDTFMRDTLAPLIQPPMRTYEMLKAAIVDRL